MSTFLDENELDSLLVETNQGPIPVSLIAGAAKGAAGGLKKIFQKKPGGTKFGNLIRSITKKGSGASDTPSSSAPNASDTTAVTTQSSGFMDIFKKYWYIFLILALVIVYFLFFSKSKKRKY